MLHQHFESVLDLNSVASGGVPGINSVVINPWSSGVGGGVGEEGTPYLGSSFPEFNISFGTTRGQGYEEGYGRQESPNNWFGSILGTNNNGYPISPPFTEEDIKNWISIESNRGKWTLSHNYKLGLKEKYF